MQGCNSGTRRTTKVAFGWAVFVACCSSAWSGCRADLGDGRPQPLFRREQVIVRFPDDHAMDTVQTEMIVDAVLAQPALSGLPRSWQFTGEVTIRLAAGDWSEVDGRAVIGARSVVLPYPAALHWSKAKIARVIRHEFVHIALAEYLNNDYLPHWLAEGFAEWEGGALDGDLTLRLEMQGILKDGSWPPPLLSLGRSRVDYDLSATFIEYLDGESNGGVRSTKFLRAVRDLGVYRSFPQVLGKDFRDVERDWHAYIARTYGHPDEDLGSVPVR